MSKDGVKRWAMRLLVCTGLLMGCSAETNTGPGAADARGGGADSEVEEGESADTQPLGEDARTAPDSGLRSDTGGAPDQPGLVYEGSFELRNSDDAATLAAYSEVSGDLTISAPELTELDLPLLTRVGGTLSFHWNRKLSVFELPALERTGDLDIYENWETLTAVSLPALTTCAEVSISKNTFLETLALPALTKVSSIHISNHDQLISVALSGLTSVEGALGVNRSAKLEGFELPALTSAASVHLFENDMLSSFAIPGLTAVSQWIIVADMPVLTDFDLNSLETIGDRLSVYTNAALLTLGLNALTSVGGLLAIKDNASLAQCLVDAWIAQVGVGDESVITGNNPHCSCTEVDGSLTASCL